MDDLFYSPFVGWLALVFGLLTLLLYGAMLAGQTFPLKLFKKLEPMREKFGHGAGTAIHFFFYVAVPLGVGVHILLNLP